MHINLMCFGRVEGIMASRDLAPGLWLIGIGPGDVEHMTDRAKNIARRCRTRYLEGYTAVLPIEQEALLEELVGPWKKVMRPSVEKPKELLSEARRKAVALMVVGDPMQATTHIDLEARCMEEGVSFEVVPGLSATSLSISLSGLQSYKFGRQVTLPYQYGEYLAISPVEMISTNYQNGLHSLVLLDLDPTGMGFDPPKPMSPSQAVSVLENMAGRYLEEHEMGLVPEGNVSDWRGLLLSDVGTANQRVSSGKLGDIAKIEGGFMHSFIIPAKMSENEEDAFRRRQLE